MFSVELCVETCTYLWRTKTRAGGAPAVLKLMGSAPKGASFALDSNWNLYFAGRLFSFFPLTRRETNCCSCTKPSFSDPCVDGRGLLGGVTRLDACVGIQAGKVISTVASSKFRTRHALLLWKLSPVSVFSWPTWGSSCGSFVTNASCQRVFFYCYRGSVLA